MNDKPLSEFINNMYLRGMFDGMRAVVRDAKDDPDFVPTMLEHFAALGDDDFELWKREVRDVGEEIERLRSK